MNIAMDGRQTRAGSNFAHYFWVENGTCMKFCSYMLQDSLSIHKSEGAGQAHHERTQWLLEENHLRKAPFSLAPLHINRAPSSRKCWICTTASNREYCASHTHTHSRASEGERKRKRENWGLFNSPPCSFCFSSPSTLWTGHMQANRSRLMSHICLRLSIYAINRA